MNLTDNLKASAANHGDRVAVKMDDAELTYTQLEALAAKVAGWLRELGIEPGDRVALSLPNIPQMPVLYYGVLWAGGVVVPTNPLYKSREFAHVLRDSGAKAFFAWNAVDEEAGKGAAEAGVTYVSVDPASFLAELGTYEAVEGVDRDADDTAVILYTSGTTGAPKGAELTHANMMRNAEISASESIAGMSAGDVVFGGLPLFHVFGQTTMMNAAVLTGATLTLLPRFDPAKALEVIARDKVTQMGGVPTMYVALSQFPDRGDYDTSSLRRCVSGGSALPVEVLGAFEEAYDAPILEGYGLSETSPVAAFNHADRERKAGSVGQPIDGVELKLIDAEWNEVPDGEDGEIAISGHNVMKGYFGNPEATASAIRDGWFRTGDIGRRDEDGYYYIVDRAKDMIIRGGYNIYPREIEEVLYAHPAVGSVAVVGIPHETHGEEVAAVVIPKPGQTLTENEVREFAKERVAAYKYPRVVRIVSELPLGPTGKILKRAIVVD
ncbi:long-chain fatty acid--CoA ligase [Rhodococcus sp. Q]|uniref:long-chain-fatty-acid--CoA ligase n=1 Tax=Rhodococcus sp. Q TaxID=2502252 RepID=UPI0010F7E191|nr:long-chain fatty acid--CoA ligase [Rhodococcus sp. Q]